MHSKIVDVALTILVIVLGGLFIWPAFSHVLAVTTSACTTEVKICPNGSAVSRAGPLCEFASCPVAANTKGNVTLGVGEKGSFKGLTITFNALVQDSRCPADVQCIEAGAVNTNVTFASGSHSETKNMPSDEVPQTFDGYHISILTVIPPRMSKIEIPPNVYRITFHMTQ